MKKLILILLSAIICFNLLVFCVSADEYVHIPEVKSGFVVGIADSTTVKDLFYVFPHKIISHLKGAVTVPSEAQTPIATGDTLRIGLIYYTAVVMGDLDRDGCVTESDFDVMKLCYLQGKSFNTREMRYAAGVASPTASELLRLKRHTLGTCDYAAEYYKPTSEIVDEESGWSSEWK